MSFTLSLRFLCALGITVRTYVRTTLVTLLAKQAFETAAADRQAKPTFFYALKIATSATSERQQKCPMTQGRESTMGHNEKRGYFYYLLLCPDL